MTEPASAPGLRIEVTGPNFTMEYGDKRVEGPLSDVEWVRFSRDRRERGSFYLKMQSGKALSAPVLKGQGLLDSAQTLATRAGQVAVLRLWPKIKAGGEVDLGAVRLTQETLKVKGPPGFRSLPVTRLTCHAVREGYWLADFDGALAAKVPMGKVQNLHALLAMIDRLVPGRALEAIAEAARPKGSLLKPSAAD